jgi:hypothetical protein
MLASRLDELRARKREASAELRALGVAKKKRRDNEARKRSTAARAWDVAGAMARVAVVIYTLARFVVEPAVLYLRQCGRRRHWPERSDPELAALLSWERRGHPLVEGKGRRGRLGPGGLQKERVRLRRVCRGKGSRRT